MWHACRVVTADHRVWRLAKGSWAEVVPGLRACSAAHAPDDGLWVGEQGARLMQGPLETMHVIAATQSHSAHVIMPACACHLPLLQWAGRAGNATAYTL